MNQTRRLRLPALAVVAVLGLGACLSNPSARTVAVDWIESMDGITDSQRTCLIAQIDEFTDAQLDAAFQGYVEDLETSCMQSG